MFGQTRARVIFAVALILSSCASPNPTVTPNELTESSIPPRTDAPSTKAALTPEPTATATNDPLKGAFYVLQPVERIVFAPRGLPRAIALMDHKMVMLNLVTGESIYDLGETTGRPYWLPDGNHFAVESEEEDQVRIWDAATGSPLQVITIPASHELVWSPDGTLAAAVPDDAILDPAVLGRNVDIYRLSDMAWILRFESPLGIVRAKWSGGGRYLFIQGSGPDAFTGAYIVDTQTLSIRPTQDNLQTWLGDYRQVNWVDFNFISIIGTNSRTELLKIAADDTVFVSPDESRFITTGYDGSTTTLWNALDFTSQQTLNFQALVHQWSPDGQVVVVAHQNVSFMNLAVWNLATGEVKPIPIHISLQTAEDINPIWLADGSILLFDTQPGRVIAWQFQP